MIGPESTYQAEATSMGAAVATGEPPFFYRRLKETSGTLAADSSNLTFGEARNLKPSDPRYAAVSAKMAEITATFQDAMEQLQQLMEFEYPVIEDEVKTIDTKPLPQRITVNKKIQRVRFENETESSVDVVIEPK